MLTLRTDKLLLFVLCLSLLASTAVAQSVHLKRDGERASRRFVSESGLASTRGSHQARLERRYLSAVDFR
jgi:Na+-transporting NADH:ubiquinone oxidoreductase subunit NqrC